MRPLKKKVSLTLDEKLLAELVLLAEKSDRSISQYVNMILREWSLNRQKSDETVRAGEERQFI